MNKAISIFPCESCSVHAGYFWQEAKNVGFLQEIKPQANSSVFVIRKEHLFKS